MVNIPTYIIGGGVTSAGRWLAAPNPLTVGLMGLLYSPGLNEGEENYLNRYHLSEIVERFSKVPVRMMRLNLVTGNYEFWEPREN